MNGTTEIQLRKTIYIVCYTNLAAINKQQLPGVVKFPNICSPSGHVVAIHE